MPATTHTVSIYCYSDDEATVSGETLTDEQITNIRTALEDPNGVIELDRGSRGIVWIPAHAVSAVYIHD